MSKLSNGELLNFLRIKLIGCQVEGRDPCKGCEDKKYCYLPQAYQQIKEMIKRPRVTEEWIKEKAVEIYNLSYYESFHPKQIAECIRSLVEEI